MTPIPLIPILTPTPLPSCSKFKAKVLSNDSDFFLADTEDYVLLDLLRYKSIRQGSSLSSDGEKTYSYMPCKVFKRRTFVSVSIAVICKVFASLYL